MSTQNLIQIKRSVTTQTPPSLANGELAWSANGDTLWIGNFGTVTPVGGEGYILDLVQGGNFDIFANTITAASDLIAQTNFTIDDFSFNGVTEDLETLSSNTLLATSEAIKTYVDDQTSGLGEAVANTQIVFSDSGVLSGSNNFVFDFATDILTVGNSSVNTTISSAGIDTDGTLNVEQNTTLNDGLTVQSTTNNQVVIERDNGTGLRFKGKNLANDDVITYAGIFSNEAFGTTPQTKTRLVIGSNEDASLEVQTSNELRLSAVDNNTGGGKVRIASGDGGGSPHTIEFHPGTQAEVDNLVVSISTNGMIIAGELEIDAIASDLIPSANLTHALGNSSSWFSELYVGNVVGGNVSVDNVIVSGNLFVEGTLTQIDTEQLKIDDNLIKLASNNTTDAIDIGFYGPYDDGGGQLFTGLFRDASDGTFKFFDSLDGNTSPITTIGGTAVLVPIAVGGLTIDDSASAFINVGGTNGAAYQVLQNDENGLPSWGSLDGGTF